MTKIKEINLDGNDQDIVFTIFECNGFYYIVDEYDFIVAECDDYEEANKLITNLY